ncbi:hypothetical protein ACFLZO_00315 [Patescibacteria group bacterium]
MDKDEEKKRACMKCKKDKPIDDGYMKLGGMFFCCKNCCEPRHINPDESKEKKKDEDGDGPNVCEFC